MKDEKIWISFEEATRALDKFRFFYQNSFVDFMGGEPMLYPQILDIVGYSAQIGLKPTVITHGMHLANNKRVEEFARAGIHDFLISIHGIGETVTAIHGRGSANFERQMRALDNLRVLGIPFRFNVTMIRDNLTQLEAITEIAGKKDARVVNFLTFNPYFEWKENTNIDFQVSHSEIVPYLAKAIDKCTELGIEANVRYMPPCLLPGREAHVYTGFQLPYDPHEWDYNSWYDAGQPGTPSPKWYLQAAEHQRVRHSYVRVAACGTCAINSICDGFHSQYVERWGEDEARPYSGALVSDPCHFVRNQKKIACTPSKNVPVDPKLASELELTQFRPSADHRAGIRNNAERRRDG